MSFNNYTKLLQHRLLTKEETHELVEQYQKSSDPKVKQQLEEELLRHNFKYIYKLSCNFYNSHPSSNIDDCIQVASMGFRKAINKFDISRNLSLSTYLTWWVRSFLQRNWQRTHRVRVLPVHIQEQARSIGKFSKEYSLAHDGRKPSVLHIAEELDIKPSKVKNILIAMRSTVSLNTKVNEKDDGTTQLLEMLEDTRVDTPSTILDKQELITSTHALLSTLKPKHREIINLRFGLTGRPPMSLQAIGDYYGFTRENARQISNKALQQLRNDKQSKELLDLYCS